MEVRDKILLVDDDADNIATLQELLADDYDLKIAANSEQTLEIAPHFQPDIIFVDIMTPDMDGYELCRRLGGYSALERTKIIMVSAEANISERLKSYEAGADDYITKSLDADEFLAKLHLYLRLKHAEETDHIRNEFTVAAMETLSVPVVVARRIISGVNENISGQINSDIRHQLETASWCIEDAERIIDSLLEISEIHTGAVEFQPSRFSMQSVVREVVSLLEPQAALKEVALNTEMAADELLVVADRRSVFKMLESLLGEIIRITHGGNEVQVRVKDAGDKVAVEVEGGELCTEVASIDDLFNPFDQTRTDVVSGGHGGGLGLAVARELAELHGGDVRTEDRPDGSRVFALDIPICGRTARPAQPELSDVT
jgi:CheY-like chemotaxis protein